MTASPSGLSAALLPTQRTLCGSEPKAFPVGKGTQCPFSAPQEQGSSPALAFPRQPWLGPARACPSMEPSWGRAERLPPDISGPVTGTALSTYLCDTREAAFLDVSFLPGGDFNHCMSALIPPSAPALQILKMDHDCFPPCISLSYVPSLLLSNFSPFFSSLFLIFLPVMFYSSPAAAMIHDSPGLRACGAPQQAQCAECISPLVAPQRCPTVQPPLWANMSTSGDDIISS